MILREVNPSDASRLFELVNDPAVRMNSFNEHAVSWDEHVQWFNSKLNDKKSRMYIALDNDSSLIGQIRVDNEEGCGAITFSVSASCRGRGFGTELLKQIIRLWELGSFNVSRIVGRVKTTNPASQKAFIKAGFTETLQPEYLEYWYPNPPEGAVNAKS